MVTISGSVNFEGLTGVDYSELVQAYMDAERYRLNRSTSEKELYGKKVEFIQTLNTNLSSLDTKANAINLLSEFLSISATSSDTTIFTASAGTFAELAAHSIEVNQLAKWTILVHDGVDDKTAALDAGSDRTFAYKVGGGDSISRTVVAGTTLEGLATLINEDLNNGGVRASIIYDGSETGGYHLVLTGTQTGADYAITIDDTLTDFAGDQFDTSNWEQTQTAQNARIKVDGYPSTGYIERSTNTITDLFTDVTISLLDEGTSTLTVATNSSAMKTKIEDFVTAVNNIRTFYQVATEYDTSDSSNNGPFAGETMLHTIMSEIDKIIVSAPPDLVSKYGYSSGQYTSLGQIGITTGEDGLLEIDETELLAALDDDSENVARLFVNDTENSTKGIAQLMAEKMDYLADPIDGPTYAMVDGFNDMITEFDKKIERELRRLNLVESRLTEKFLTLQRLLSQLQGQLNYIEANLGSLPTIGGGTSS